MALHRTSRKNSSQLSYTNHALPFELLGAVFSYISEDPLDLRYAIFVCRFWHNAIVRHANLWTNIILRHTFLTRFRGARLPHGDAFVRSCVSRSWPLPLHISIHGPDCYSLYAKPKRSPLSYECFSLFKHIVSKFTESGTLFQRCRSLIWICCYGLEEVDLVAQAFASASAPALEYLTIKDVYPEGRLVHFPRLPRLKEVTLMEYSYGFRQPIFHDDDFAKAEKLTFIADVWSDHGVDFIRRFRNIRALILKDPNTFHLCMLTLGGHINPVELPLLETLSLYGMVAHQVLCLIRAPGLRKMEIEADMARGHHSLTATNLVHLVRTLECLYLSLKEGEHATSWVEELERLVAEAPVLASICISPWMMQYLTGKEWRTRLHCITDCDRNLRSPPMHTITK